MTFPSRRGPIAPAFAEQLDGPARAGHQFLVRVEAQAVEQRGRDVIRRAGLAGGSHALGIGAAVRVAGACNHHDEGNNPWS